MTVVNVSSLSGRTVQVSYLGPYTGSGVLSIGTVDTDDAVTQYQQSVTIPLTNFTETITAVTLNGTTCPIQSQVVGTSVTVDFPGNLATGTYTLSVSGATESATKSIDYTQTHPYTSPVGSVDSNSLFSSPVLITAGTYHRIVSGPSNGTLDAAGAESGSLWGNDVADIYTPNEGFTGNDSVQIEVLFDDGTTDTINATITVETPVDTTPAAFSFADQTDVEPDSVDESNAITITAVDAGEDVLVSITGGSYAVSTDGGATWGAFTTASTNVQLNYQIKVQVTASSSFSTAASATLTAGGVSDTFTRTTRAAVLPTQDVTLPDLNVGQSEAVSVDLDSYFSGASSYAVSGLPAGSGYSFSGSTIVGQGNDNDLAASPFTVTVTASSADGSIQDSFSVAVSDDIAPVISVHPLSTLDTSPIVSGSAGDATSLTLVVDGVTYNPTPSGGTWSQQLPTLALGDYAMTLNGQDAVGNAAVEKTATLSIVLELPSSALSVIAPVISPAITSAIEDAIS